MEFNGLLTLLTFFPLVGVVAILLLKPFKVETDKLIKQVAIATVIITFIIALVVLFSFDKAIGPW
jgi:NADH:ubiquinone oxidoreductase subunit 4 (subunit M)